MKRPFVSALQIVVGALLALVLVAAGAWWWTNSVTYLRVGVAQQRASESYVIAAFARVLEEQKKDIRLELVTFPTVHDSARALQQRRVDLALVRPDVFLPNNGLTVAILSEEAVIVVSRSADVADLAGKKLGLLPRQPDDLELLRKVLKFYDVAPAPSVEAIGTGNVAAALQSKAIDAIATIAPVGALPKAELRAAFRAAPGMKLVPLGRGAASALESTAFEEITVPEGSLGGAPGQPEEELRSLGVSYRLMAQSGLDRGPISVLTEHLFQMRQRIAKVAPAINLMQAPEEETATSAALPNHPGAIDYFEREQQTFMDRYGDWVWLTVLLAGSASSALVSMRQVFARARRRREDELITRLVALLNEVRGAETTEDLDRISGQADEVVIEAVRQAHSGATSARTISALVLAVDSLRMALMEKRGSAPPQLPRTALRVHPLNVDRSRPENAGNTTR